MHAFAIHGSSDQHFKCRWGELEWVGGLLETVDSISNTAYHRENSGRLRREGEAFCVTSRNAEALFSFYNLGFVPFYDFPSG